MVRLEIALGLTLRFEGGFSDHPSDPGGRTMKGITQRVYDAWRMEQGYGPDRDVRDIEVREVQAIYSGRYWNPSRAADLPPPVDIVHFDCAVNCGVGRAIKLLQAAVGVAVDGAFGPVTGAVVREAPADWLADALLWERERYYRELTGRREDLGVFLRGWLWRIEELRWAAEVGLPGRGKWRTAA